MGIEVAILAFSTSPTAWNPGGRAHEKTVTHPSSCTFSFSRSRHLGTQSVVPSNREGRREGRTRGLIPAPCRLAAAETRDEAGHVGSTAMPLWRRCGAALGERRGPWSSH